MSTVLAKYAHSGADPGIETRFREGDEAAQIAFVRAWRARARFRGDSALRTWLIRIVINVARSMRQRSDVEQGLEGAEALPDTRTSPDEQIMRRGLRQRVRNAVQRLPERQREVVLLKVFAEMTHREVAGLMGLSEGSVKAHLHQAVANLRRRMVGPVPKGEC